MASESIHEDRSTPSGSADAPILGDRARLLIKCNQRLQDLHIQDTIKLPRIIVVGDQSAGKSSLIEALSTITVPKASGVCTKCPILINLSNSSNMSWSCTIYLEENYSYNARKKTITDQRPLGPWERRDNPKVTKFRTFSDKAQLEALITDAQQLILQPNRKSDDPGHNKRTVPASALAFSPNIVRIDIKAPDFYDLSLIDLPGTTAAVGIGQEEYVVDLVRNLTALYAKDENNVILLALPLTTDFENSTAFGLIQKHKLQERTIRVFTQVDRASPEYLQRCLDNYLHNKIHSFGHGQHMVMLKPTENETETDFFGKVPWTDFSDSVRANLGTRRLRDRIREILFVQTRTTLPANLVSISDRLATVRMELKGYPAPLQPYALFMKLYTLLSSFEGSAKRIFEEKSNPRLELRQVMESFAAIFAKTTPTNSFMTQAEISALRAEWTNLVLSPEPGYDITRSRRRFEYAGTRFLAYDLDLTAVKAVNDRHRHAGTPGIVNPSAIDEMYRASVRDWSNILRLFSKIVKDLIEQTVKDTIDQVFHDEQHLPVYAQVNNIADTFVTHALTSLDTFVNRKLQAEMATTYTLKTSFKSDYVQNASKLARSKRREALYIIQYPPKYEEQVPKTFMAPSKENESVQDDQDEYTIMYASVQAHYKSASDNLVDTICKDILAILIPTLQEGLVPNIRQVLKLNTDDYNNNVNVAAKLMCEDPAREYRRQQLLEEERNLLEGDAYIKKTIADLSAAHQISGSESMMQNAFEQPRTEGSLESPKRGSDAMSGDMHAAQDRIKRQRTEDAEARDVYESIERETSLPDRSSSAQPRRSS